MFSRCLLASRHESVGLVTISSSGRKYYRHSSNMGTVMEYNDGQPRKTMLLDAAYRTYRTGMILTSVSSTLISSLFGSSKIRQIGNYTYSLGNPAGFSHLTDAQINSAMPQDVHNSTHNTDVLVNTLGITNTLAARFCRSIQVGSVKSSVANLNVTIRAYCDSQLIDSMDPTVSRYPNGSLLKWNFANLPEYGTCCLGTVNSVVTSSSTHGSSWMQVYYNYVGYIGYACNSAHGVLPVIDL